MKNKNQKEGRDGIRKRSRENQEANVETITRKHEDPSNYLCLLPSYCLPSDSFSLAFTFLPWNQWYHSTFWPGGWRDQQTTKHLWRRRGKKRRSKKKQREARVESREGISIYARKHTKRKCWAKDCKTGTESMNKGNENIQDGNAWQSTSSLHFSGIGSIVHVFIAVVESKSSDSRKNQGPIFKVIRME